jgi:ATP-dependent DNA helicase RecG
VVIDEQHKFGVRQRALLKQAGTDPHYLVMTATPIPRTVALTLYGDLEVSTIRESPPGRQTVHTYLAGPQQRQKWWQFVSRKLREGRQAYVITPMVDEAEELPVANLQETFEELANGPLEAFRLGLLHGRMTPADKDAAMDAFRSGRTQALIATTVVEVGIDVPNATLMTVEGAERFGLSQLHQLRGRLSRGAHPGYCCLFADPTNNEARQRLEVFTSTTDGFRLAELDFEHRGPGDLLGTKQHGLPPLRIADLRRDTNVLDEARRDAQQLVELDPGLAAPQHERLRKMVVARYGRVLELGDVG